MFLYCILNFRLKCWVQKVSVSRTFIYLTRADIRGRGNIPKTHFLSQMNKYRAKCSWYSWRAVTQSKQQNEFFNLVPAAAWKDTTCTHPAVSFIPPSNLYLYSTFQNTHQLFNLALMPIVISSQVSKNSAQKASRRQKRATHCLHDSERDHRFTRSLPPSKVNQSRRRWRGLLGR